MLEVCPKGNVGNETVRREVLDRLTDVQERRADPTKPEEHNKTMSYTYIERLEKHYAEMETMGLRGFQRFAKKCLPLDVAGIFEAVADFIMLEAKTNNCYDRVDGLVKIFYEIAIKN